MDRETEEVVSIVTSAFRWAEIGYVVVSPRKALIESSRASLARKTHPLRESLIFEWYGLNRRLSMFVEIFIPLRSTTYTVSFQGLEENFPLSDRRWVDSETIKLYAPISFFQKTLLKIRFLLFYRKIMASLKGEGDE